MDCEQARNHIVESLYEELPSEEAVELQEHLSTCAGCVAYREQLRDTLACLDQREELRAPVDLAALHAALDRKSHPLRYLVYRRWVIWSVAVVGVCSLIFSLFALAITEIRYDDHALTIRFGEPRKESIAEETARVLSAYRQEQWRFQKQLTENLQDSITDLSRLIDAYEARRDQQITEVFQQVQRQQRQVLSAMQQELDILASQTERELKRNYLTMSTLLSPQENQSP